MKIRNINKVLIANRGEVAIRIIRTLHKLDIKALAVFPEHDAHAWHTQMADEAWSLGQGSLKDTYLNVDKIIAIALKSGADAIHPGYGFLSENPDLVEACIKNNLIFIGPDTNNIRLMGNKIEARKIAVENDLPVTQGLTGNSQELLKQAKKITFPILVKAAAGGGGKGMRIVHAFEDLEGILETTSREAKNYFGDGSVYIEQFIMNPRHIEIQVLGDKFGNVIHFFERECSVQRRYQKIVEESPSPTLTEGIRQQMGDAAVQLCKAIRYESAGTIEFLVDSNLNYYFLEMNTRIQVEHPVTEMVTGVDLVEEQIRIAQGYPLSIRQEDVRQKGHAIECRIYAEDPSNGFLPSPGNISLYIEPEMVHLRIDSSMNTESEVLRFYDPMISKLVAWGEDRQQAIKKAEEALENFVVHGIKTNISYLQQLIQHPQFVKNEISTRFCDTATEEILESICQKREKINALEIISAFLLFNLNKNLLEGVENIWKEIGYWRHTMKFDILLNNQTYNAEILEINAGYLLAIISGKQVRLRMRSFEHGKLLYDADEQSLKAFISEDNEGFTLVQIKGMIFNMRRNDQLNTSLDHALLSSSDEDGSLFAPMPGKVIKVSVKEGDRVNRGAILLVVEAMKMENNIVAPSESIVEQINVKAGDMVDTKTQMIHLKEVEEISNQNNTP
jgi:acetyl-CoA carboxylase biotin carboxylase subunit